MNYVYRRPFDYRRSPTHFFALRHAAGAASATAGLNLGLTGTLTGTGQLAAVCSLTMGVSATASGSTQMTASSDLTTDLSGTLLGSGALVSTISMTFDLQATGQVSSAYSPLMYRPTKRWPQREVDWRAYTDRLVIFPLNALSDITGSASLVFGMTGTLTGTAATAATAAQTITLSGTLLGAGALAAQPAMTITLSGTATGAVSGDVAASADMMLGASGTLLGTGELISVAAMQFTLAGTATKTVAMFANAGMTISLTGTLSDISGIVLLPAKSSRIAKVRRKYRTVAVH